MTRFFVFTLIFLYPAIVLAQGAPPAAPSANKRSPSVATENFDKTERFLPGEEVVTPTGKKMKVWSTEGPVKVSPAPEPFERASESQIPANSHIVIDAEAVRERRRIERGSDSFDLRR